MNFKLKKSNKLRNLNDSKGFENLIELLLKHGASVDAKDNDCKTALIIASEKGFFLLLNFFNEDFIFFFIFIT